MVIWKSDIMDDGDIVKEGHLRRLKTLKKRFFVLRSSPRKGKSRLEYYESEKKFRSKGPPKRVIYLASCLNIAKKEDSKHKLVFALYTRDYFFGLIAESEDELNAWMKILNVEKRKDEILNASVSTWPVDVKPRGLGTSRNLAGQFDLQLSTRNLALVKKDTKEPATELQLVNIRRCGHTDCFFFMELGRSAATGAGELWIQVDDQIIAQNMHEAILSAMHNISSSDLPPITRRRCESEGKKKTRPRPVSAMIYPPGRGRSDTEPTSPNPLVRTISSSVSTRNLSEFESPKNKTPSVLNRLRSRRKSKEGLNTSLESPVKNREEKDSGFGDKVLMQPPSKPVEQKEDQLVYMNLGSKTVGETSSMEDYMAMDGETGSRKNSDSYVDMEASKSKAVKAFTIVDNEQSNTKTTHAVPNGGYMDMTSLQKQHSDKQNGTAKNPSSSPRTGYVQQSKSSSPRQLRTTESALPNKPDIREFVSIKTSPSSSRRRSSQDYVSMCPLAVDSGGSPSYVNVLPGANSPRSRSPNPDARHRKEDSNGYYVNFTPGADSSNRGKFLEIPSLLKRVNNSEDSSSNEDMHSYVNYSPGKIIDEKNSNNSFRKHSLESDLLDKPRAYENIDLSGITKSKSAVDVPEYVNFFPGEICESSKNDVFLVNDDRDTGLVKALDHVEFSPEKPQVEGQRWRKSPHANRRDSEPARLQTPKLVTNAPLTTTQEDEEIKQLNYVMLDLSNPENSSESPSRQRRRPANIDLTSCRRGSPGPKSAPVRSAYAEVDFTKSDGIRQARQERRESANTLVFN